jgi:rhodanese-related sulfurtransferase
MTEISFVTASALKQLLGDNREIAVVDVREAGEFADGHLLFATSIPLGIFETQLLKLVPMPHARLVLVDEGVSGRAEWAATLAIASGYTDVACLRGGTAAWKDEGFNLFEGVYVPSKVFGELVEKGFDVPHISAQTLASWQQEDRQFLLLDGRPFDEHHKMNIPGSICLPNGELPYRIGTVLKDDDTPIVVHCAGRTRSIIGAQILRDLGLKNPIFALQNGTQGWALASLPLEVGSVRMVKDAPDTLDQQTMVSKAKTAAVQWEIPLIDTKTVNAWAADTTLTTYFFDVRTVEEYVHDGIAGSVHAPGGQLIQSTDVWAAVRRARIVLIDHIELRAVTVARWLSQMGWDCSVLAGGTEEWKTVTIPTPKSPPRFGLPQIMSPTPESAIILDTRVSTEFRRAHIAGACWTLRSRATGIAPDLKTAKIILCGDLEISETIAGDLDKAGYSGLVYLKGGPAEWHAMGYEIVTTPNDPKDQEAVDFVFFTHDRHSGNMEAARQYLAWETGLVARLDPQELNAFRIAAENHR